MAAVMCHWMAALLHCNRSKSLRESSRKLNSQQQNLGAKGERMYGGVGGEAEVIRALQYLNVLLFWFLVMQSAALCTRLMLMAFIKLIFP